MAGVVAWSIVGREVRTETATTTAEELAGPLAALCRDDEQRAQRAGADCPRAQAIAREGLDGAAGTPGRGIVGTTMAGGRLIVTYTDGVVVDVGRVIGAPGTAGEQGRGITSTVLDGGRLVVAYSDGERVDLGPVVGRDGVGISGVDGSTGRLVVTLTNGTVLDAGPLPQGPPGAQGVAGATGPAGDPAPSVRSVTRTYDDGAVERCTRSGGPDTDPELTCSTTRPSEETPPATTGAGPVPPLLGGG